MHEARLYFESAVRGHNTTTNQGSQQQSERIRSPKEPEWSRAYYKDLPNGQAVVVPLDLRNQITYKLANGRYEPLTGKVFMLLFKDADNTIRIEVVTRMPDLEHLNSTEKDKEFSGTVLVEDWQGNLIKKFEICNNKVRKASPLSSSGKGQVGQYAPSGTATNEVWCETMTWYSCAYGGGEEYCNEMYSETTCWGSWDEGSTGGANPDESYYWDSEGGGGSGGDYLETRQSEPCVEKDELSTASANPIISNQNSQILSSTASSGKEYGAEQNLTTIPSRSYINIPVRTDGTSSTFTPKFTWNSIDGYTIGASHGHPSNGAPSPADALWPISNINNPQLVSANGRDYYKGNASVTVVTNAGIFVVTVKDWSVLEQHYWNFYTDWHTEQAGNQIYRDYALDYKTKNITASTQEMTAYALLKMYGDAINLYSAPSGSIKLQPLQIDSQGQLTTMPCV